MNALLPLIEQAIITGVLSKKAPFMRKSKFGLGLMALSVLLFGVSVVFGIIAGYGWLLMQFPQVTAALILAGGVLGFSILLALCGLFVTRKKPQPMMETDELAQIMSVVTDLIGEDLLEPIKENPKTAMILASAAGFVAGDRLN